MDKWKAGFEILDENGEYFCTLARDVKPDDVVARDLFLDRAGAVKAMPEEPVPWAITNWLAPWSMHG
jgi:hypothetical protein